MSDPGKWERRFLDAVGRGDMPGVLPCPHELTAPQIMRSDAVAAAAQLVASRIRDTGPGEDIAEVLATAKILTEWIETGDIQVDDDA